MSQRTCRIIALGKLKALQPPSHTRPVGVGRGTARVEGWECSRLERAAVQILNVVASSLARSRQLKRSKLPLQLRSIRGESGPKPHAKAVGVAIGKRVKIPARAGDLRKGVGVRGRSRGQGLYSVLMRGEPRNASCVEGARAGEKNPNKVGSSGGRPNLKPHLLIPAPRTDNRTRSPR